MEKVNGIGGFFFRSPENERLGSWYEDNLGVKRAPTDYGISPWQQEQGPTAFAPFPNDTEYFGDVQKVWKIDFRVSNLDAMVRQLRDSGIEVNVDRETYPNGKFAPLHDPEGNPTELWEPSAANRPGMQSRRSFMSRPALTGSSRDLMEIWIGLRNSKALRYSQIMRSSCNASMRSLSEELHSKKSSLFLPGLTRRKSSL